jgi:hypothetical protein
VFGHVEVDNPAPIMRQHDEDEPNPEPVGRHS